MYLAHEPINRITAAAAATDKYCFSMHKSTKTHIFVHRINIYICVCAKYLFMCFSYVFVSTQILWKFIYFYTCVCTCDYKYMCELDFLFLFCLFCILFTSCCCWHLMYALYIWNSLKGYTMHIEYIHMIYVWTQTHPQTHLFCYF